jgi:hypothetical protein
MTYSRKTERDVYHFVVKGSSRIEEAIKAPSSYPFVGVLTQFDSSNGDIEPRKEISTMQFEYLLDHISVVFIDVYDNMSFLIIEFRPR